MKHLLPSGPFLAWLVYLLVRAKIKPFQENYVFFNTYIVGTLLFWNAISFYLVSFLAWILGRKPSPLTNFGLATLIVGIASGLIFLSVLLNLLQPQVPALRPVTVLNELQASWVRWAQKDWFLSPRTGSLGRLSQCLVSRYHPEVTALLINEKSIFVAVVVSNCCREEFYVRILEINDLAFSPRGSEVNPFNHKPKISQLWASQNMTWNQVRELDFGQQLQRLGIQGIKETRPETEFRPVGNSQAASKFDLKGVFLFGNGGHSYWRYGTNEIVIADPDGVPRADVYLWTPW